MKFWIHLSPNFQFVNTVKPVKNGHFQKVQKLVYKTNYLLMQVKSIAECSKGSILQYFWPSLSYHLSFKIFILSIFEWLFYTGFTVDKNSYFHKQKKLK